MPDPVPPTPSKPNWYSILTTIASALAVIVALFTKPEPAPSPVPPTPVVVPVVPPKPVPPAPAPEPVIDPTVDYRYYVTDSKGNDVAAPGIVAAVKDGVGSYSVEARATGHPVRHLTVTIAEGGKPTPAPAPSPVPGPVPVPVPDGPSAEMQALVAPLKVVMARSDAAKAATFQAIWNDWRDALKAGPVPATSGQFKAATQQFTNTAATRAGLAGAFPGFSAELEKLFDSYIGAEDVPMTAEKATEFAAAVAWACGR